MKRDLIFIRNLELKAVIGTRPAERRRRQRLYFNLTLHTDLAPAGRSDELRDALDYSELERRVAELVKNSSFQLLEALAEAVAGLLLSFAAVRKATVQIDKPGASRQAESVAVLITRKNRKKKKSGKKDHIE